MKDDTCTVRRLFVYGEHVEIHGFVRVLDCMALPGGVRLIVLCSEDPVVWRLRLQVVQLDTPTPCLTGLTSIGQWSGWGMVFMHPPARADDVQWEPHRADMTLVTP